MRAPHCKNCGKRLMRWGWYESHNEPVKYWYCMACDFRGIGPYIQVFPNNCMDVKKEDGK